MRGERRAGNWRAFANYSQNGASVHYLQLRGTSYRSLRANSGHSRYSESSLKGDGRTASCTRAFDPFRPLNTLSGNLRCA